MTSAAPETNIGTARRRQLVDAAIAEIAASGLVEASTVKIARRAGVSRGVLTHHFASREQLIDAVVATVYRVAEEELGPVVARAPTPRDQLEAFVAGSVDFYAAYPDHMGALGEIFLARQRARTPRHQQEMTAVADILRAGQAAGQFRDFDVDTMAAVIRATLDAALQQIRATGRTEPLRTEIVRTLALATER